MWDNVSNLPNLCLQRGLWTSGITCQSQHVPTSALRSTMFHSLCHSLCHSSCHSLCPCVARQRRQRRAMASPQRRSCELPCQRPVRRGGMTAAKTWSLLIPSAKRVQRHTKRCKEMQRPVKRVGKYVKHYETNCTMCTLNALQMSLNYTKLPRIGMDRHLSGLESLAGGCSGWHCRWLVEAVAGLMGNTQPLGAIRCLWEMNKQRHLCTKIVYDSIR